MNTRRSIRPTSDLGVVDIPSDIKTVTYFVCSEDTFDAAKSPGLMNGSPQPSVSGRGRGLMRRELSQAVSSWAEANGNLNSTYSDAKLLAEEVVGLQFRYYDGKGWLDDWNSDDLGGLPTAVEITVTIQPTYGMSDEGAGGTVGRRGSAGEDLQPDRPPARRPACSRGEHDGRRYGCRRFGRAGAGGDAMRRTASESTSKSEPAAPWC